MNYKETGGAMFLGINGAVIKAHGSSTKSLLRRNSSAYNCVGGGVWKKSNKSWRKLPNRSGRIKKYFPISY
jgi:fatty acid/phospholipid biosynthesis enzyme